MTTPVVVVTDSTSWSGLAKRCRGTAAARSQHQRVDQEQVPVDQVAPAQRLDQLAAAEDGRSSPGRRLSPAIGRRRRALQQGGVARESSPQVVEATYSRPCRAPR